MEVAAWSLVMHSPGIPIERAGGSAPCSVSPPAVAITLLPGPPVFVFYKYFSLPFSPLFGFAAVEQENQSQGGGVLVFDSFGKSRYVEDR